MRGPIQDLRGSIQCLPSGPPKMKKAKTFSFHLYGARSVRGPFIESFHFCLKNLGCAIGTPTLLTAPSTSIILNTVLACSPPPFDPLYEALQLHCSQHASSPLLPLLPAAAVRELCICACAVGPVTFQQGTLAHERVA